MTESDKQKFFDSEPLVLDIFEHFFTFEFYVRYLRSMHNQELQNVLELKELIKNRFVELDVMSTLFNGRFAFDDDPEETYSTDIELHELVGWTLNAIQSSECRLDNLCSELCRMKLPKQLVDRLFTPFNELHDKVEPSLNWICYHFSAITSPNNIQAVFKWWCFHIKQYIRDELKLVGKFGTTRVEQDEDGNTVDSFSDLPLKTPRIIFIRKDNYDIYNTDHHEISIDGEPLSKSMVLNIKFDADAHNLEQILDEFRIRFSGAQSLWLFDQLQSGFYPAFECNSSKSTIDSVIKAPRQNYTLVKNHTTISKYLIGLMCYDALMLAEGEQKISLKDASEDIEKKISRIKPHKADTITQYYYNVEKIINTINDVIRKKHPNKLF